MPPFPGGRALFIVVIFGCLIKLQMVENSSHKSKRCVELSINFIESNISFIRYLQYIFSGMARYFHISFPYLHRL